MKAPAQAKPEVTASLTPTRTGMLQRKCSCGGVPGRDGECEECRTNREVTILQRSSLSVQGRADPATKSPLPAVATDRRCESVSPIVHEALRLPGQALDPSARAFFETRFGHDFSRVRVHADTKADEAAEKLQAQAFTVGKGIYFRRSAYAPRSERGRRLLAHELAHVVQQGQPSGQTTPHCLRVSQPTDALERQADAVRDRILQSPGVGREGRGDILSEPHDDSGASSRVRFNAQRTASLATGGHSTIPATIHRQSYPPPPGVRPEPPPQEVPEQRIVGRPARSINKDHKACLDKVEEARNLQDRLAELLCPALGARYGASPSKKPIGMPLGVGLAAVCSAVLKDANFRAYKNGVERCNDTKACLEAGASVRKKPSDCKKWGGLFGSVVHPWPDFDNEKDEYGEWPLP